MRTLNRVKILIAITSLAVFVASLTQDALTYNDFDGKKTHSSLSLLVMGGTSILGGGLLEWITWLANPLYFVGLILLMKSDKRSLYSSAGATLVALSFAAWTNILAAENGRMAPIDELKIGYYLWVASLALLTMGIWGISGKLSAKQK